MFKQTSIKATARIAGLLYFLQIPFGVFGLVYVQKLVICPGNLSGTTAKILENEFLFRLSILSTIICALLTIATSVYISKVLKPVGQTYAKWIVIFTLVVAPISMLNELNNVAILLLLKNKELADVFTSLQLDQLVSMFLSLHKFGIHLAGIFFGLWLLPMGYLVLKSTYIPKIIGISLFLTCLGYLIDFSTFILFPNFGILFSDYTWFSEVMMVLWLLIKGVNIKKYNEWMQTSH